MDLNENFVQACNQEKEVIGEAFINVNKEPEVLEALLASFGEFEDVSKKSVREEVRDHVRNDEPCESKLPLGYSTKPSETFLIDNIDGSDKTKHIATLEKDESIITGDEMTDMVKLRPAEEPPPVYPPADSTEFISIGQREWEPEVIVQTVEAPKILTAGNLEASEQTIPDMYSSYINSIKDPTHDPNNISMVEECEVISTSKHNKYSVDGTTAFGDVGEDELGRRSRRSSLIGAVKSQAPIKKPRLRSKTSRSNIRINYVEDEALLSFSEDDEQDAELIDGDTDYRPRKRKSKTLISSYKPKRHTKVSVVVFDCNFCHFVSEALGELKIHIYNSHDGTSPSYLDMAEAAVIRLEDGTGFGLNQEDIVKEVLFEHFDDIADVRVTALEQLDHALKAGVKLGRLQTARKGKSSPRYRLASKEKMAVVAQKWKECSSSVELSVSKKMAKIKSSVSSMKRKMAPVYDTQSSVYELDGSPEISIVSESLSPLAKARQKRKLNVITNLKPSIDWRFSSQNFIPLPSSSSCSEDDDYRLSCPHCWLSFWYHSQLINHIHNFHNENAEG